MRSPHPWYLIADIIWYLTCVYFPLSVKWNSSSSIAFFGQRTNKCRADFGTELFMGHFPHKYCTCSFAISTGPSLLLANCIWLWNKSIIHAFRNVASRWCWSTVLHYFLLSRKYTKVTFTVQILYNFVISTCLFLFLSNHIPLYNTRIIHALKNVTAHWLWIPQTMAGTTLVMLAAQAWYNATNIDEFICLTKRKIIS